MHRGTRLAIVLLVLAAIACAVWWLSHDVSDAPPSNAPRTEAPPTADPPPALIGAGGDGLASPSGTSPAEGALPDDPAEPGWFLVGDVETLRPEVATARVEVHWWPAKPRDPTAEPAAVFATDDLDLSGGGAEFRLEGRGAGFVLLFLVTSEGRQAYGPYLANPWREVTPGFGIGVVTGYVGTQTFAGRTIDVDGQPVPGVSLYVMDTAKPGWPVRTRSDAEGRFGLPGLHSPHLEVTVEEKRVRGGVPEFAGFSKRAVRLVEGVDATIVLHRYPLVHLVGRVDAYGDGDLVAANVVRPTQKQPDGTWRAAEQRWWYDLQQGMRLRPGRWRLQATFHYLGTHEVDTPDLALDSEVTVEVPLPVDPVQPLLRLRLPVGTRSVDDVVQVAAAAHRVTSSKGWSGSQVAGPGSQIVLPLSPGRWSVYAAVRVNDRVWISKDHGLEIAEGERLTLTLPVERAAGIVVPATPERYSGRAWHHLVTREFPGPGVVQGDPFQTFHLTNRPRETTWWVPPGRHVLERWGPGDKPLPNHYLELDLSPGEVVRLEEGPQGLRTAGEDAR